MTAVLAVAVIGHAFAWPVAAADRQIRGVVVNQRGDPVPNAVVYLDEFDAWDFGARLLPHNQVVTGSDGAFTLVLRRPPTTGRFLLIINGRRRPGGEADSVNAKPSFTKLNVLRVGDNFVPTPPLSAEEELRRHRKMAKRLGAKRAQPVKRATRRDF